VYYQETEVAVMLHQFSQTNFFSSLS